MIDYGIVGVVMGGGSAEREVSIRSGQSVISALKSLGYQTVAIDGMHELKSMVRKNKVDTIFNIMHGMEGENGIMAAWAAAENIPITGCLYEGALFSWYKSHAKYAVSAFGLQTPPAYLFDQQSIIEQKHLCPSEKGWIVKPNCEGSSVGIHKVDDFNQLKAVVEEVLSFNDSVLVESYVEGIECTVGIVNGHVLPVVSIEPEGVLYDYEAKYESVKTKYYCPSVLDEKVENLVKQDALRAFKALSLRGWARVDFIIDGQGDRWFLEANTTPGMTQSSLVPKAAKEYGWAFDKLVLEILKTSLSGEEI